MTDFDSDFIKDAESQVDSRESVSPVKDGYAVRIWDEGVVQVDVINDSPVSSRNLEQAYSASACVAPAEREPLAGEIFSQHRRWGEVYDDGQ